jgi:hypothetical protein
LPKVCRFFATGQQASCRVGQAALILGRCLQVGLSRLA